MDTITILQNQLLIMKVLYDLDKNGKWKQELVEQILYIEARIRALS